MIYNSIVYVQRDLQSQRKKLERYRKAMVGLPEGSLVATTKKKQRYYQKVIQQNGNKKIIYLGKDDQIEVQQLQARYFLQKSIAAMESNIKLMDTFIKKYENIDPNILQASFPAAYKSLPENCFDIAGAIDIEQWAKTSYTKNNKYPEYLRHRTKQGFLVRSKSELVIANAIAARGIKCRYEEVLHLDDSTFYPDFTIVNPLENKIIYWEHFGLAKNPEYLKQCLFKLNKYIENGIVPGVNLIVTFDDDKGNIDSMMIERTLDLWFSQG